jgi:hypothetical protein
MNKISLSPASDEEIQQSFPAFYAPGSLFFFMTYQEQDVGVYGITDVHDPNWKGKTGEISVCVFEDYRYKIPYRQALKLLLYYPFYLNYDNILISSINKSIITLMNVCKKMGVTPLGNHEGKTWFAIRGDQR